MIKKNILLSLLGVTTISVGVIAFDKELLVATKEKVETIAQRVYDYKNNENSLIEKYNATVKKANNSVGNLKGRIRELEEQVKTDESKIVELEGKLQEAEADKESLNAEITRLKGEISEANITIENLKKQIQDLESQLKEEKDKNSNLQLQISGLEEEVMAANEDIANFNLYLDGKVNNINENYNPIDVGSLEDIDEEGSNFKENDLFSAYVKFYKNKIDIILRTKKDLDFKFAVGHNEWIIITFKDDEDNVVYYNGAYTPKFLFGEDYKYYPTGGRPEEGNLSNNLVAGEYYYAWDFAKVAKEKFETITKVEIEFMLNGESRMIIVEK